MKVDLKGFPKDAQLQRKLDAVPALERHRVGDRATRAGGKVIHKRARQLTPRGEQKDRDRKSKADPEIDWQTPLWKTIKLVVRKYRRGNAVAIIGPQWPKGNKVYFFTSPKGRRVHSHGQFTGHIAPEIRNWIIQVADETKGQQTQAIGQALRTAMKEIWERGR